MATTRRSDLVDELEKALRDEAYDGGMGALGPEPFTEYVRGLAVTAAKVVAEAHTPTDDERVRAAVLQAAEEEFGGSYGGEEIAERAVAALRRSEVPEPSADRGEFAPGECDGSGTCSAQRHIHGCYTVHRADQCDAPEEYGHLPAEPEGEPSDADLRAVAGALAAIDGKPWFFDTGTDRRYESSARVILRALRAAGGEGR